MKDKVIWHSTNAGSETRPVVWRLEGKQVVTFLASVAIGLMVFRILGADQGLGLVLNLGIASLIPGTTTVVILQFFVGKPPSYFSDWIAWFLQGSGRGSRPLISPTTLKDNEQ